MDNKKLFKQMLEMNKSSFDFAFSSMVLLQEQAEKMTEAQLSQAEWLPEEGKSAIRNWMKAYREGRENLKKVTDTSFQYVDEYIKTL